MNKTALFIISLFLLWGCSREDPSKNETKGELHTYKVSSQKVQAYVEATGTIQPDLDGGAKIVSPLQGSVKKIFVRTGDSIKKGMPLVALRSSDVSDTYASHLSTLSQLKQAERIYNLNKELFEVGAITRNDLLNSEANYEQAKALSEGLKQKLDIYGAHSPDSLNDELIIKAPIDGRVADIQAHIGDRFDTSIPLMTVANSDKVIVVANIYDTDIPKIKKGKQVTFFTDIFPDVQFKGAVSYISDVEDMDSKTIKTYITIMSGRELLKQNMFLKIKIIEGEKILPVVPKTALIYEEGKFYVNLKQGERVGRHEIKPLRDISDKFIAVEGLKDGDEIVYSAIDLEKT